MKKITSVIALAVALAACDREIHVPAATRVVDASTMVLLTRIDGATRIGDPVRFRQTGQDGCHVLGILAKDFRIAMNMIECGGKVARGRIFSGAIALSRAHTFTDADGNAQAGYDVGERFALPDVGIDFDKLRDALNKANGQASSHG